MTPTVRPVSSFEFARMWGGAGFCPDLLQRVHNEWNRNPGLDDDERVEVEWQLIACWAGGSLYDLLYGESR